MSRIAIVTASRSCSGGARNAIIPTGCQTVSGHDRDGVRGALQTVYGEAQPQDRSGGQVSLGLRGEDFVVCQRLERHGISEAPLSAR